MGISNFQKYIKETYSDAIKKQWNDNYDNLYIDLNYVLHCFCNASTNLNELLEKLKDYLYGIINNVCPKKKLILVADGSAPLAKMLLQRKRRMAAVNQSENLSLNLTAGTEFMKGLENSLSDFIKYIEKSFEIVVITLITDQGEGELKIKNYLQKAQEKNQEESHIVYSNDSDMILLLFLCKHLNKIYQIIGKDTIIFFGKLYDIHIEKFVGTKSTKNDFVFINILMGNDYVPKTSYLTLDKVWIEYKKLAPFFENGLISYDTLTMGIKLDPIFFHDLLYCSTKQIKPHFMNKFALTDLKKKYYYDYVQGLYWCFGMYFTGKCSNYHYIYDHDESPHVLGTMLTAMTNSTYKMIKCRSIDLDLYAILLIPEKAKNLLTKEQNLIARELVKKYPIVYEEGRCDKCKIYNKLLKELKIKYKTFNPEIDILSEDCVSQDSQEQVNATDDKEKHSVKNRINTINRKLLKHKETHEILTSEIIDKISDNFVEVRDILRETMSLNSDSDEPQPVQIFVPPKSRNAVLFKKKLF